MFSPEEQQIEIMLLKSNLEEILNDLIAQRSAIPALDAESEQNCRETLIALRETRALNTEIENLNQENVILTAKRLQLKRKSEEVSEAIERACRDRSVLEESLKQEERDTDLEVRKYEDTLRELADNFRSTPAFFDEDEFTKQVETLKEINSSLLNEEKKLQSNVCELQRELTSLQTDVPEDILAIVGQTDLEQTFKSLSEKCEMLYSKRDNVLKNQPSTSSQSNN